MVAFNNQPPDEQPDDSPSPASERMQEVIDDTLADTKVFTVNNPAGDTVAQLGVAGESKSATPFAKFFRPGGECVYVYEDSSDSLVITISDRTGCIRALIDLSPDSRLSLTIGDASLHHPVASFTTKILQDVPEQQPAEE